MAPRVHDAIGEFTLLETQRAGHAPELVSQALRDGFDRIVCVGGDGTIFECVNGFFDASGPINIDATFGIIPFGTGCDFARSVDVPKGEGAIPALAANKIATIDTCRLSCQTDAGEPVRHCFLNAAHAGLGGNVAAISNRSSKVFGGFLTFLYAVLAARFTTKPVHMEIDVDGERIEGEFLDAIVAHGQFDGGGMHSAPKSRLDDGLLDVYLIGPFSIVESLWNLPMLYRGEQDKHEKVSYLRGRRVTVTSKQPVLVNADGELAGQSPVTFEVVPQSLRMITGPNPLGVSPQRPTESGPTDR